MIKKITLIGPESTGKTTLAAQLAKYYATTWVPEYARAYIDQLKRPYKKEDLLIIAKQQIKNEKELEKKANKLLICDTNLLVIKIWSEYKYKTCDPWILKEIIERKYDFHLLLKPDIPWEQDSQREHPHKRNFFFNLYRDVLESYQFPFAIITQSYSKRFQNACNAIESAKI